MSGQTSGARVLAAGVADPDDAAAVGERCDAALERAAADGVDDEVDAAPVGEPPHLARRTSVASRSRCRGRCRARASRVEPVVARRGREHRRARPPSRAGSRRGRRRRRRPGPAPSRPPAGGRTRRGSRRRCRTRSGCPPRPRASQRRRGSRQADRGGHATSSAWEPAPIVATTRSTDLDSRSRRRRPRGSCPRAW